MTSSQFFKQTNGGLSVPDQIGDFLFPSKGTTNLLFCVKVKGYTRTVDDRLSGMVNFHQQLRAKL